MKLSDTASGLIVVCVGLLVGAYAWSIPTPPGQAIGPSLFPLVVATGFIVFGTLLVVIGWGQARGPWVVFDDWVHRPRMAANFGLVLADLLFYAVAVDSLGFFITSTVFLGVLLAAFRVKRSWIPPVAIGVTLAMHCVFYTLLRVPLPWGVLEGIAW